MTEARPRSRTAARSGVSLVSGGARWSSRWACPRPRDVVRRLAVAGGQGAERAAFEQTGDHRGGSAVPGGLVQRRVPGRTAESPLVDRDPLRSSTSKTSAQRPALAASARRWLRSTTSSLSRRGLEDSRPRVASRHAARVDPSGCGHLQALVRVDGADLEVRVAVEQQLRARRPTRPASPSSRRGLRRPCQRAQAGSRGRRARRRPCPPRPSTRPCPPEPARAWTTPSAPGRRFRLGRERGTLPSDFSL